MSAAASVLRVKPRFFLMPAVSCSVFSSVSFFLLPWRWREGDRWFWGRKNEEEKNIQGKKNQTTQPSRFTHGRGLKNPQQMAVNWQLVWSPPPLPNPPIPKKKVIRSFQSSARRARLVSIISHPFFRSHPRLWCRSNWNSCFHLRDLKPLTA